MYLYNVFVFMLCLILQKMRSLRWDVVGTVSKRHVSIPNVPVLPLQEMKLSTNTVIVLGKTLSSKLEIAGVVSGEVSCRDSECALLISFHEIFCAHDPVLASTAW